MRNTRVALNCHHRLFHASGEANYRRVQMACRQQKEQFSFEFNLPLRFTGRPVVEVSVEVDHTSHPPGVRPEGAWPCVRIVRNPLISAGRCAAWAVLVMNPSRMDLRDA